MANKKAAQGVRCFIMGCAKLSYSQSFLPHHPGACAFVVVS